PTGIFNNRNPRIVTDESMCELSERDIANQGRQPTRERRIHRLDLVAQPGMFDTVSKKKHAYIEGEEQMDDANQVKHRPRGLVGFNPCTQTSQMFKSPDGHLRDKQQLYGKRT